MELDLTINKNIDKQKKDIRQYVKIDGNVYSVYGSLRFNLINKKDVESELKNIDSSSEESKLARKKELNKINKLFN